MTMIDLPRQKYNPTASELATDDHADDPAVHLDAEHGEYVLIPVNRGKHHAKVSPEDYQRLRSAGWLSGWSYASNGQGSDYVRANIPGHVASLTTIARLILQAGPGDVVRYHRDDRLDLRRSNLYLKDRDDHVEPYRNRPSSPSKEEQ